MNDYVFVNAGFSDTSANWEITGLTPNTTYEIYAYGGVARDMALTVDIDGDGSLVNNSSTLVTLALAFFLKTSHPVLLEQLAV